MQYARPADGPGEPPCRPACRRVLSVAPGPDEGNAARGFRRSIGGSPTAMTRPLVTRRYAVWLVPFLALSVTIPLPALGARLTVAYVPKPLQGYAVIAALACQEIVMGSEASIGPIATDDQPIDPARRELLRGLAVRTGRDPDLLVGMLDREADLRAVRT